MGPSEVQGWLEEHGWKSIGADLWWAGGEMWLYYLDYLDAWTVGLGNGPTWRGPSNPSTPQEALALYHVEVLQSLRELEAVVAAQRALVAQVALAAGLPLDGGE